MSQQHLTESQLPINHEVLIEMKIRFRNALTAKKIDGKNKIYPNNQNHRPIHEKNCQISRKSGAGISNLCFRYTETTPHNNATKDDNLKNKNLKKFAYTVNYCSPKLKQFITIIKSEIIILRSRTVFPWDACQGLIDPGTFTLN